MIIYDVTTLDAFIHKIWEESIIPALSRYIAIPCKSVHFDSQWEQNAYMDQAIDLVTKWCWQQPVAGMDITVHKLQGRTPLLLLDIAGQCDKNVLLYGHIDKQPEMTGWREDLGPWKPVLEAGKLYGRGGADDGYAVFSALTAILALQAQNIPHPRCLILIESCEESGSVDLPAYLSHLKVQLGTPDLVICLDSGAQNYEQLWCTQSLRGMINIALTVEILTQGVHSGLASGIVPCSFAILRQLLSRVEDQATGRILIDDLHVAVPENRINSAKAMANLCGDAIWQQYPWVAGARPLERDNAQLILKRTWQPALSVTGMDHMPIPSKAGNVLRPKTSIKLSFRTPPTCDVSKAAKALKAILEKSPPYGAKVCAAILETVSGWNAPDVAQWLLSATDAASKAHFGKPAMYQGEGGSIPFIPALACQFPEAQFMVTGVLGPHSNAHGPNEFLHIEMAKKVTACVASVLASYGVR